MTTKTIPAKTITNCGQCPNCIAFDSDIPIERPKGKFHSGICLAHRGLNNDYNAIHDLNRIPFWCKLEDSNENVDVTRSGYVP